MRWTRACVWLCLAAQLACGDDDDRGGDLLDGGPDVDAAADASGALDGGADAAVADAGDASQDPRLTALPYARRVERFSAGAYAGFGRERFPDVVLGPPRGLGTEAGSLDVLSLGVGGEIVLDLGDRPVVDGPGPDFIVFENAFWPSGRRESVFAELGEVAAGDDPANLRVFPCARTPLADGSYPGCAGWTPTRMFDPLAVVPLDPAITGGDPFDLAAIGLERARYVRIRDLAQEGSGDNGGFDLDALGVIHGS